MTIFFYIPKKNEKIRRLLKELESIIPEKDRKIFQNLEEFSRMLIRSFDNQRIALLLLFSRPEFLSVFTIRDLLLDVSLILVAPDREADTVRMAHTLHPRFLSYADTSVKDVGDVLKQMISFRKNLNPATTLALKGQIDTAQASGLGAASPTNYKL